MALTMTINGTGFGTPAAGNGRFADSVNPGAPEYDIREFHPVGCDGNQIIKAGFVGQTISVRCFYRDTITTIYSNIQADLSAWSNGAITVVAGATWTNCWLVASECSPPITDNAGVSVVYVNYTFRKRN